MADQHAGLQAKLMQLSSIAMREDHTGSYRSLWALSSQLTYSSHLCRDL